MKKIKFIDVHVHGFLKPADKHRFRENITTLVDQGLEKIIITALPYHDFDYHLKLSLAPEHIHPVAVVALTLGKIDQHRGSHFGRAVR